jgi:predicted nucleic acid-binding protein
MNRIKVYLDNCCYGRPFDDLTQTEIKREATAKIFIQSLVKFNILELYSSFMLFREISDNPFASIKDNILTYLDEYSSVFISEDKEAEIRILSEEIMKTGIKNKDAIHLACSIIAECDYFITTDKRVINFKTSRIKIVNPVEFVEIWGKQYD